MAAQPLPEATGHEIIAALIDETLANGDIVPAIEAERILGMMQNHYPAQWAEYASEECRRLVGDALRSALSSRRQRARRHHAAALFGQAIASADPERLSTFRLWRCRVDSTNTQRCLGDMLREDHEFVANTYRAQSQQQLLLESFHRTIARKLPPGRRTEDVLSEAEVMSLYDRLVGEQTP